MSAGGASLSLHSLTAATLGAAACVPLLMLRAGMWSSQARTKFPVLEEVQRWQAEVSLPVLHNMTHVQVLAAAPRALLAGLAAIMNVACSVCMSGMLCCYCLHDLLLATHVHLLMLWISCKMAIQDSYAVYVCPWKRGFGSFLPIVQDVLKPTGQGVVAQ